MKKILLLFAVVFLFAAAQNTQKDNFCGSPVVQINSFIFHCPKRKGYKTLLKNFSFNSPNYTCVYMQNGQTVHVCDYTSEDVQNAISDANEKFNSAIGLYNISGALKNTIIQTANSDLFTNSEKENMNIEQLIQNLEKVEYNKIHGNGKIAAGDYKLINKYLINIYKNPSEHKELKYSFSRFLIGLITLSPQVVTGYNPINGDIKLSREWIDNTVNFRSYQTEGQRFDEVWRDIKQVAHEMDPFIPHNTGDNSNISLTNSTVTLNMAGWYKIFDLKLWGFYYDFMSKMDKAVRYIVMMLFALAATYGGGKLLFTSGVSYYLSRDELNFKNPDKIIGTSVVVLMIGMFFLSPPTKMNGKTYFYTNDTIAKSLMRKLLFTGDKMATMTNDFATAAYLDYVLHKENIANPTDVFKQSLEDLKQLYLFKEMEPQLKACLAYYNYAGNIQNFLTDTLQDLKMSDPMLYMNRFSNYYNLTGADEISYNSCIKMAKNYEIEKNMLKTDIIALNSELKDYNENVPLAMKFFTLAQIETNRRYGWISMITVPVNYFIVSNAGLFIDNGISEDVIEKVAQNDVKSLKFKTYLKTGNSSGSNIKTLTASAVGEGAGYASYIGSYFMLPFFADYYKHIYTVLKDTFLSSNQSKGGILRNIKAFALKTANKIGSGDLLLKIFGIAGKAKMLLIAIASFFIALFFWKLTLKTLFIITFALLVLLEIVFYFKDVLIYFVTSVFVPIWAMQKQGSQKIEKYFGEGIALMFRPVVLVFIVYIAIFVMGLYSTLHYFILYISYYVNKELIQYLIAASNNGIYGFFSGMGGIFYVESIKAVGDVVGLLVKYIIGFIVLFRGVEYIMKKFGYQNESLFTHVAEKATKFTNPI